MSSQAPSDFRKMWVVAGLFLIACESSGKGQPVCINDCPVPCGNGVQDGLETGVDCGGECSPCVVAASCSNGVMDGLETDIDCGGSCPPCGPGAVCAVGSDCVAGVCAEAVCVDPTCDDAVRNGFESDVDCGPGCEPCGEGQACGFDPDCVSGACSEGVCVTCDDGVKNARETGVDCGGGLCNPCGEGDVCEENTDCESTACEDKVCIGCRDGVQNGDEEDVDCGGSSCEPCLTQACEDDNTCFHGLCVDGRCALPAATAVAAQGSHVCVLVQKGHVRCWGANDEGMGTGGRNPLSWVMTENADGEVVQLSGMTRIFAGREANCASSPEGLFCWGTYLYQPEVGSLRTGSILAVNIRYLLDNQWRSMGAVTSVGIGERHICALVNGRSICWGSNQYRQHGNGTSATNANTPASTRFASTQGQQVVQVVAGAYHNCARTFSGAVWCWGRNEFSACGKEEVSDGNVCAEPYPLPSFTQPGLTASAVYAALDASCALESATVRCWGNRPFVTGGASQFRDIPFAYSGWTGVTHFALGSGFMCAKTADGVSCVGAPGGIMGLNFSTPVAVAGLEGADVLDLVAGHDFACALLADGEVRCWGANDQGQLGDGTTESRATAAPWVF